MREPVRVEEGWIPGPLPPPDGIVRVRSEKAAIGSKAQCLPESKFFYEMQPAPTFAKFSSFDDLSPLMAMQPITRSDGGNDQLIGVTRDGPRNQPSPLHDPPITDTYFVRMFRLH